jgi:hypothetical protein
MLRARDPTSRVVKMTLEGEGSLTVNLAKLVIQLEGLCVLYECNYVYVQDRYTDRLRICPGNIIRHGYRGQDGSRCFISGP